MFDRFFRKKEKTRVLEYQSTREIADLKKELSTELRASIYFFDDSKFIICSIAGCAEYGEPTVLESDCKDEELGLELCNALLKFKQRDIVKKPSGKLSDWNAFQASGEKTGKAFELKSVFVYISTNNSAISISARPRISNEDNLSAVYSTSIGSRHIEIGAAIRKAIHASSILREAGTL